MKKLAKIGTALTLVSAVCLAGCDKKAEEAPSGGEVGKTVNANVGGAVATGVPECDDYLKAFDALTKCDKAGPALEGLKQGLEASKAAWGSWKDMDEASRKAAQQAAGPGCKAGADAIKQTAASMGCN
jgi:hypothetical protein